MCCKNHLKSANPPTTTNSDKIRVIRSFFVHILQNVRCIRRSSSNAKHLHRVLNVDSCMTASGTIIGLHNLYEGTNTEIEGTRYYVNCKVAFRI